ncbi:MAG: hypothetical protein FJ352_02460 [Firmicutes bacterium]|nr:hypothetical protein [Bacillota bacterium]
MKKSFHKVWPWLASSVLLTACGADVAAVYERTLYHTNVFENNYYVDDVLLDTFAEDHITNVEATFEFDASQITQTIPTSNDDANDDANGDQFALNHKLSLALPVVNYGIESKLFDGILYCTDAQRLSKSRLQLRPSGMGYLFPSPLQSSTNQTLGLFMKAGADMDAGAEHIQDLNVQFTIFKTSGNGYSAIKLNLEITDLVTTFYPDYYQISLPANTLDGTIGFSFTYEIVNPVPSNDLQTLTGIFLYEVLFPSSIF